MKLYQTEEILTPKFLNHIENLGNQGFEPSVLLRMIKKEMSVQLTDEYKSRMDSGQMEEIALI
jgi:hypothetical protein